MRLRCGLQHSVMLVERGTAASSTLRPKMGFSMRSREPKAKRAMIMTLGPSHDYPGLRNAAVGRG